MANLQAAELDVSDDVADATHRPTPVQVLSEAPHVEAVRVTAVVVNYNAGNLLARCVAALRRSGMPLDIVIVDNASRDDSLDRVEADPALNGNMDIVRLDRNLGFAAAVNHGVRRCTTPWLLVVNPDCIIEPDTVREMLVAADHEQVGMVGALVLNPDGTEQRGCRRLTPTIGNTFGRLFGLHYLLGQAWDFNLTGTPLPAGPADIEMISGALMLVRRHALSDVGGLDEGYFLHCEDLDWCHRFRDSGWRIRFSPMARAVHFQGACSRRTPIRVLWHKHRGMLRYFRKHHGGVLSAAFVPIALACRFTVLASRALLLRLARRRLSGSQ